MPYLNDARRGDVFVGGSSSIYVVLHPSDEFHSRIRVAVARQGAERHVGGRYTDVNVGEEMMFSTTARAHFPRDNTEWRHGDLVDIARQRVSHMPDLVSPVRNFELRFRPGDVVTGLDGGGVGMVVSPTNAGHQTGVFAMDTQRVETWSDHGAISYANVAEVTQWDDALRRVRWDAHNVERSPEDELRELVYGLPEEEQAHTIEEGQTGQGRESDTDSDTEDEDATEAHVPDLSSLRDLRTNSDYAYWMYDMSTHPQANVWYADMPRSYFRREGGVHIDRRMTDMRHMLALAREHDFMVSLAPRQLSARDNFGMMVDLRRPFADSHAYFHRDDACSTEHVFMWEAENTLDFPIAWNGDEWVRDLDLWMAQADLGSWTPFPDVLPTQVACPRCGASSERDDLYHSDAGSVCGTCYEQRCRSCETVVRESQVRGPRGRRYCDACHESQIRTNPEYARMFLTEDDDLEPSFHIDHYRFDPLFQRRLTSVELEFNAGSAQADVITEELARRGLSNANQMQSYHSDMRDWAHVESDGTVSGGEMIVRTVDLNTPLGAAVLWSAFDCLRRPVKDGRLRLGLNCGAHIHVDASDMTNGDMLSLAVIHGYLEDVLFRLASANWKKHRGTHGGPKASYQIVREMRAGGRIAQQLANLSQRSFALNMQGTLQARGHCSCDASRSLTTRCTCGAMERHRNTVEFRWPNATANPKKVMAYIGLTQGIMEWASRNAANPLVLAPMDYAGEDPDFENDWEVYAQRLEWIFENLPMTPTERNAVRYCVRHSQLSGLEAFLPAESYDFLTVDEPEDEAPTGFALPRDYMVRIPDGRELSLREVDQHMFPLAEFQNEANEFVRPIPVALAMQGHPDRASDEIDLAGPDPDFGDDDYYDQDDEY